MLISGGVDSAVAAYRLMEQGHDLHLFYIRIGMDNGEGDCSAEEDIEMCRYYAKQFNLPLEVVSLHEEYWENVMEYALRTGHYAATAIVDGVKYLATAVDPVKDQTDFLARISYKQLSHLLFPLGDIPKSDVRRIAAETRMPNAFRKDSQGICFLGKINYNDFIRRHLGEKTGPIIEIETGRKLGEHRGYWFHTIGQRKGLGLSGGPWYVVKKNVHDNAIYVSRGYDTDKQYGKLLHITETQFISGDPWGNDCSSVPIAFKNRHTPVFTRATLTRLDEGEYVIESADPIQGIAPGQFAVIYTPDNRLCLGSGIITGKPV